MTDGTIQEQVMARAIKDQTFRHELLNNPRAVLAREYQVHLPENMSPFGCWRSHPTPSR